MKLMIASDIHGSAYHCQKMIEAFHAEQAEKLLLLGDLLYHGPKNGPFEGYSPKEVITMLNNLKQQIFCVRGNCDVEVDQEVLEFPIMADYCILSVGKRLIYATHGHRYNMKTLPPIQAGDILLHGHTHIPAWESFGNQNLYLNPGSVSMPKEESRHGYMILDKDSVVWKALDGTVCHSLTL